MAEFPFYEPEKVLRRNLITNPSFEAGTGWTVIGGSVLLTDTFASQMWDGAGSGNRHAQASSDGSSAYLTLLQDSATIWSVTPGKWVGVAVLAASDTTGVKGVRSDVVCYGDATTYNRSGEFIPSGFYTGSRIVYAFQAPSGATTARVRVQMYSGDSATLLPEGARLWADSIVSTVAETREGALAAVSTYFDGDTPDTDTLGYRWLPDGSSEEYALERNTDQIAGVTDVGISTDSRLGLVSDVYSRSREKIQLELARVDSQLIAGERVELDAAAMTASPVVWHWRQITGPTVELEPREASMDFIAPDVDEDTPLRIAVYAASEDGRNRSDWHYFDLTIKPPIARYRASESAEFEPVSPKYVGYDRGKREIWNDVIPPSGFSEHPRHDAEILDLGILPDDVQFTNGEPPEVAAAGGIYVDIETGDIYRNFGAGYNETDDTTAAPRTNAWWVNPATGDILEWIED